MEGVGEIVFEYQPSNWSHENFIKLGGFVAVFLNYNKKDQIKRAVESVLNQDYPLIEMIFMDDASTDGSGDEMEKIVRASVSGMPHKVMIVRNKVNQYITGQWNIASRLTTGNWLGMFCGDDFSRPDRITRTAEFIKKHPTLLGVCSSAESWDSKTGKSLGISKTSPTYFANGTDSLEELNNGFCTLGATAFWHKSLFEGLLPRVPMDDTFLHFRCYLLGRESSAPVWAYTSDFIGVDYSVGTGVTSSAVIGKRDTPIQKWIFSVKTRKHFMATLVNPTMIALRQECINQHLSNGYQLYFRMRAACTKWDGLSTISRLLYLPYLLYTIFSCKFSASFQLQTIKWLFKVMVLEFLGLYVGAFISTKFLHKNCNKV